MIRYPLQPYVIGSGFANSERYQIHGFARYWIAHIQRFANPGHIYVLNHDVEIMPKCLTSREGLGLTIIPGGNLGHVHQLVGEQLPAKNNQFGGWSASVLMLALIAYNAERDFVYVEQDCLIYGDCIGQIYREANDRNKDMMFGSCRIMPAAQSLFWIRHRFIPIFVRDYLMGKSDNDPTSRPEKKFVALEKSIPGKVGRFSFGIDRDRPIPWGPLPWYCQQWTEEELQEAEKRHLLYY